MFKVDPMAQDARTACLVFTTKFRGTSVTVLATLFLVLSYFLWFGCLDLYMVIATCGEWFLYKGWDIPEMSLLI